MLLYILLTIIAIGVCLASEPGRLLLAIILLLGVVGFVLYVGFYFVLFLFGIFFEFKSKTFSFFSFFTIGPAYEWIPLTIFGVIILGATLYKALFPFGYDKNRQIWTGKIKLDKSSEIKAGGK